MSVFALAPFIVQVVLCCLLIASLFFAYKKRYFIGLILLASAAIINCHFKTIALSITTINYKGRIFTAMCINAHLGIAPDIQKLQSVVNLVKRNNPDVVYLTEFYINAKTIKLMDDYPYMTIIPDCRGNFFFSKYPISKCSLLDTVNNSFTSLRADVLIDADTITFFGCHLASNNYSRNQTYLTPNDVNTGSDYIEYLKNYIRVSHIREKQAKIICDELTAYHSTVVLGDFNDISGSLSLEYFDKEGFTDAWMEKGFGYGSTICKPFPLRIDHILFREGSLHKIQPLDIRIINSNGVSDHNAIFAVFNFY